MSISNEFVNRSFPDQPPNACFFYAESEPSIPSQSSSRFNVGLFLNHSGRSTHASRYASTIRHPIKHIITVNEQKVTVQTHIYGLRKRDYRFEIIDGPSAVVGMESGKRTGHNKVCPHHIETKAEKFVQDTFREKGLDMSSTGTTSSRPDRQMPIDWSDDPKPKKTSKKKKPCSKKSPAKDKPPPVNPAKNTSPKRAEPAVEKMPLQDSSENIEPAPEDNLPEKQPPVQKPSSKKPTIIDVVKKPIGDLGKKWEETSKKVIATGEKNIKSGKIKVCEGNDKCQRAYELHQQAQTQDQVTTQGKEGDITLSAREASKLAHQLNHKGRTRVLEGKRQKTCGKIQQTLGKMSDAGARTFNQEYEQIGSTSVSTFASVLGNSLAYSDCYRTGDEIFEDTVKVTASCVKDQVLSNVTHAVVKEGIQQVIPKLGEKIPGVGNYLLVRDLGSRVLKAPTFVEAVGEVGHACVEMGMQVGVTGIGSELGIIIGGAVGGPPGAVIGGSIGSFVGNTGGSFLSSCYRREVIAAAM